MSVDSRIQLGKWAKLISSGHLQGVEEQIKDAIIDYSYPKNSGEALKLIIHLCHVAVQCNKEDVPRAREIFRLANTICSKIKIFSDCPKFFASVFHILKTLLGMKLFSEAKTITAFVSQGSYWHEQATDRGKMYTKLDMLWRSSIFNHIKSHNPRKIEMDFSDIVSLLKFELRLKSMASDDGSGGIFKNILEYISMFEGEKVRKDYIDQLKRELIIGYLNSVTLSLGRNSKSQAFKYALSLVNGFLIDIINEDKIGSHHNPMIRRVFSVFEKCINEDEEYGEFFKLYENICTTFIRNFDNFTEKEIQSIRQLTKQVRKIGSRLRTSENGLESMIKSTTQIMDAVLSYWERHQSSIGKDFMFEEELLISTVDFIKEGAVLYQTFDKDCICENSDCQVKKDSHSGVIMNLKTFIISNRFYSGGKIPLKLVKTIIKVAESCIECIAELQESNCSRWQKLWISCGINIYNLAVVLANDNYEDCAYIYSLLCTSMIHLNVLDFSSSFFSNNSPPLSNALHRLSSLHYQHAKYREAMITAALNAYLHYKDEECKGFRVWTNVKFKYSKALNVIIIDCLRDDKKLIEQIGMPIDLKTVDLPMICFREIKALQDARINLSSSIMKVLDALETLNPDPILYIQAVNLLGFHLINFSSKTSIEKYLKKASTLLDSKRSKSKEIELLKSHLMFYKFIEDLGNVERETEAEMQSAKIKLYAKSESTPSEPVENVVPAYSQVNVSVAAIFAAKLEKIWEIWVNLFRGDFMDKLDQSEANMTLKIIITAAEYSRFHRYNNLEIKLWKLSHNLATKLKDNRAIVYITGRSISSKHINHEWIKQAENIVAMELNTLEKEQREVIETVAMFKLSLSEYYFQSERWELAERLFQEATSLPNIDFVTCLGTYLYSLEITLAYRLKTLENIKGNRQLEYTRFIVKGLYTMLSIDDSAQSGSWSRERCLYELDFVLNFTSHIALEMNGLFASREITAHIVRRLSIVQKLANPIRAAECLKYLCLIDLSREQMDDCEVKVQGLEHILKIETFEMSMSSKSKDIKYKNYHQSELNYKPAYCVEPIRDIPHNDASPVLRKKVFVIPDFMDHDELCKCFKCTNVSYKFLVFSCTHIRAQLYSLQNQKKHASEHFQGALNIIEPLLDFSKNNQEYQFQHIIEYIIFLLDYSRHLRKIDPDSEDGLEIAEQAVKLCKRFKLEGHSVYMAASVLVFEYQCANVGLCTAVSPFIIPSINDIDLSIYDLDTKTNFTACATPCQRYEKNIGITKEISPRGKNLVPNLTLGNAAIDSVSSEEEISPGILGTVKPNNGVFAPKRRKPVPNLTLGNATIDLLLSEEEISPGPLVAVKPKKKAPVRVRPVRRKISEEDYSDAEENFKSNPLLRKSKLTTLGENGQKLNSVPLKSLIDQTRVAAPSIVEKLDILNLKDMSSAPANIEHVEELVRILAEEKAQRINSNEGFKSSRVRSTSMDSIQKIDDLMDKLRQVIDSKSKQTKASRNSKPPKTIKDSGLDSITSSIREMSIKTVKEADNRIQKSDDLDDLNSEDEVVESSLIEPRRSRRVAAQTSRKS